MTPSRIGFARNLAFCRARSPLPNPAPGLTMQVQSQLGCITSCITSEKTGALWCTRLQS